MSGPRPPPKRQNRPASASAAKRSSSSSFSTAASASKSQVVPPLKGGRAQQQPPQSHDDQRPACCRSADWTLLQGDEKDINSKLAFDEESKRFMEEFYLGVELWKQQMAAQKAAQLRKDNAHTLHEEAEKLKRMQGVRERSRRLAEDMAEWVPSSEDDEATDSDTTPRATTTVSGKTKNASSSSLRAGGEAANREETETDDECLLKSKDLLLLELVKRDLVTPQSYVWSMEAAEKFRAKDHEGALRLLNDAILSNQAITQVAHHAVLRSNRAACHLALHNHTAALSDAMAAVERDSRHGPSLGRAARCYLVQGNWRQAKRLLGSIDARRSSYDPTDEQKACTEYAQYENQREKGNLRAALQHINAVCSLCDDVALETKRIETLAAVSPEDALEEVVAITGTWPKFGAAWHWRGLLEFRNSKDGRSLDGATQAVLKATTMKHKPSVHLLSVFRTIAPLHATMISAKRERRWPQLVSACNGLMQVDMLGNRAYRSFVLLHRAQACLNLDRFDKAVQDATDGLIVDGPHTASLLDVRSRAYEAMGNYSAALRDAKRQQSIDPTQELLMRIQALNCMNDSSAPPPSSSGSPNGGRQSGWEQQHRAHSSSSSGAPRRPMPSSTTHSQTHYETLGVSRQAPQGAIKRAFREAALRWHPDKWVSRGAKLRGEAEERFKAINSAYGVLGEAATRQRYDQTIESEE